MLIGRQFQDLAGELGSKGGFTIDQRTGTSPTSGHSVSLYGHGDKFPVESQEKTALHLQDFHDSHQSLLSQPGIHMGGWRSGGNDYADISRVYPKSTGAAQAPLAAVINNQQATYDLDTGHEHQNPYYEGDEHSAQVRRQSRMSGRNITSSMPRPKTQSPLGTGASLHPGRRRG